ncbi:MAG: TonB-dependent receptor [Acidobacteriaceae bacterium]|nr:TonB-dependent receptor [Acidobacteriaceae bacterium]
MTITDVSKGWTRSATTSDSGSYEFLHLAPADTFRVVAERDGFSKEIREGIVLETGQQTRIDLVLSPGHVSQTVEVNADASLLQSEDAQVGTVVDERKVEQLPLNGRQFWQLSQLTPEVYPPTQNSSIGFRGGFNVAGHHETENNYLLDGVDNADGATMQPTNRPSVEDIQEFKVLTGIYNAEYGRYAGGQILITTKSGTNSDHGSLYEFLRNSDLDARNFFSPRDLPAFRRNQYGASNGGPIKRNRTFYFATYEALRLSDQVNALTTVPTAAMEQGNFAGLAAIKNPTTKKPFANNQIPASMLNPISLALLQYFPTPTSAGVGSNYSFSQLGTEHDEQFSGRIDQIITSRNNLFVSYQFAQRTTFWQDNTLCGGRTVPGFACTEPERDQGVSVNDIHMFSPTLLNELRLGYNRIRTNRFNQDAQFGNVDQQLGIPQLGPVTQGDLGVPQVSISGFATLGGSNGLPQGRRDNTYNIVDGVSWTKGNHSFKFGGDYKYFIYNYANPAFANSRGSFSFNGQYTGNAFADFLLGDPRSTSVNPGDPTVRSYTPSTGFYAQDEWKVTSKLTLSYGLRYELLFPEKERLDKIASFDPATGLVPVAGGQLLNVNSKGSLIQVGTSTLGSSMWKLQNNNLAPRFGFAWRPFDDTKTVVRGGYGIFYNLLPDGNGISQLFRGIPFRANETFTNTPTQLVATWTDPYPSGIAVGGYTPNGINYNFKTPYVQEWSFGIEREIAHDLILEATYLGTKGTDLPLSYNLNQPTPGVGPIQARRPYPQWGSITWIDSIGNSSFNSLAVRLERRYSNGLSLLVSYTYGHSIDDGESPATNGDGETAIQDPRNIAANRGNSEFDIRHHAVGSFVYDLPFGGDNQLGASLPAYVRWPISNWQVTGIVTLQTGAAFSITTTSDISNTGATNRPNLVADPYLSNPTPTAWFNTAAFSIALPPGTYAYGNVGRNTMRGDGLENVDFGAFRNFLLTERWNLQFRTEVFNLFNHANFGLPVGNINASNFGQVTQTSTPSRELQFALKLVF